jgi:hypothetical protein
MKKHVKIILFIKTKRACDETEHKYKCKHI